MGVLDDQGRKSVEDGASADLKLFGRFTISAIRKAASSVMVSNSA